LSNIFKNHKNPFPLQTDYFLEAKFGSAFAVNFSKLFREKKYAERFIAPLRRELRPEEYHEERVYHLLCRIHGVEDPILAEILGKVSHKYGGSAFTCVPSVAEPGRNDPCPCGSKKKYKKCCLNNSPVH